MFIAASAYALFVFIYVVYALFLLQIQSSEVLYSDTSKKPSNKIIVKVFCNHYYF